jgi:hypothetical protein
MSEMMRGVGKLGEGEAGFKRRALMQDTDC